MGTAVGIDIGTGGVRARALDDDLRCVARAAVPLPPGRRGRDGAHRLEERPILDSAAAVLEAVSGQAGPAAAVAVCGTAGTLCLRDSAGRPCADAVAYDDARHGAGIERIAAWLRNVPSATRVIAVADAVLEALGAQAGGTDWNNALRLGWDPRRRAWPAEAAGLAACLPRPAPPGSVAGRALGPPGARGALLVRGTTDGCAMQIACGALRAGEWSVSLGTTVVWKSAMHDPDGAGVARLPAGAYAHRLDATTWLPGAASNCGGGVLLALTPGADHAAADAASVLPSGYAAYPLARPGERFPVHDHRFAGFGLPRHDHPALHAAVLEGVAFVIRLGVERLCQAGVAPVGRMRISGGGAHSPTWMRVVASVLGMTVTAAPDADAALGAALLAAAALRREPVTALRPDAGALGELREHAPDRELVGPLDRAYRLVAEQVSGG